MSHATLCCTSATASPTSRLPATSCSASAGASGIKSHDVVPRDGMGWGIRLKYIKRKRGHYHGSALFYVSMLLCDPAGIQTLDLQNRNLTLYSAKLRDLKFKCSRKIKQKKRYSQISVTLFSTPQTNGGRVKSRRLWRRLSVVLSPCVVGGNGATASTRKPQSLTAVAPTCRDGEMRFFVTLCYIFAAKADANS